MSDLKHWGLLGIHVLFIAVIYALSYGGISQFSVENWVMIFTALMLILGTVTSLYLGEEVSPKIFRNAFILMAIESLALPLLFLWPYLVSSALNVVANDMGSPGYFVWNGIVNYEYCLLSGLSGLAMMGLSRWYPFKKQPWQRWVMPLLFWAIFFGILWVRLYYFIPSGKSYPISATEIQRYMYSFSYWVPALFIASGIMLAIRGMLSTSVQWLYWKEWREQRWTLLGFMLLFILPGFYEVLPYLFLFYLGISGTRLLGADSNARTFPYLMTRPFMRHQIFWIRMLLGFFSVLFSLCMCLYPLTSKELPLSSLYAAKLLTLGVIFYFLSALSSLIFRDRIKSLILWAFCSVVVVIIANISFIPMFCLADLYNVKFVNSIHLIYSAGFLVGLILVTISVLYFSFIRQVYMKWSFNKSMIGVLIAGIITIALPLGFVIDSVSQKHMLLSGNIPRTNSQGNSLHISHGKMYLCYENVIYSNNQKYNTGTKSFRTSIYEIKENAQGETECIPYYFGGIKGDKLSDIQYSFMIEDKAYVALSEPGGLRISRFDMSHSTVTTLRMMCASSDNNQSCFYTTFRVLEPVKEKDVFVDVVKGITNMETYLNAGDFMKPFAINDISSEKIYRTDSIMNVNKIFSTTAIETTWSKDSQGFLVKELRKIYQQDCAYLDIPDMNIVYSVKGENREKLFPICEVIRLDNNHYIGSLEMRPSWTVFAISSDKVARHINDLSPEIYNVVSDSRGYIYIVNSKSMLMVLDARDASNIKKIANIPYPWYQRGISYPQSMIYYDSKRKAVVVCWDNAVQVIDVKNPEKPVVKGGPITLRKNNYFYESQTLIDPVDGYFYRSMGRLIQKVDYKAILNKNRG